MTLIPLNSSSAEIRVVTLLSSDDVSSEIQCTLESVSLFPDPEYVALSYTWAESKEIRSVWVDGEMIQVTENLENALRQLRAEGNLKLWVDALCIDLDDEKEKSRQVQQMKRIYGNAASVVAWVGVEAQESNRVVDVMKDLSSGASWNSIQASFETDNFDFWAAFEAFVKRPFWSRVWILFEISVAYDLLIQCGDRQMSWADLLKALHLIQCQPKTDPIYSIIAYREAFQSNVSHPFLKALFDTHDYLVTDPRDRIYALMSLANDGPKMISQLDYSQTVLKVFRELALSIIFKNKCLEIIGLRQHDGNELENLPSWVPNWNRLRSAYRPWQKEILFREKRPVSVFADTEKLPYYYFLPGEFYFLKVLPPSIDSWGNLRTSGWVLDIVGRLTTSLKDERPASRVVISIEDQANRPAPQPNPYKGKTNEAIAKCLCLGMAFPKGIPRLGDLSSLKAISLLRDNYPHILRWLSRNKYFTIAGRPLEAHLNKSTRVYKRMFATSAFLVSDLMAVAARTYPTEEPWLSALDLEWDRPIYDGILERYLFHLDQVLSEGMRLFVSERGYLGMAHPQTRAGDKVCVISGCAIPLVMRKCENGYRVVGEAYLHDFSFDRVLEGQDFSIC